MKDKPAQKITRSLEHLIIQKRDSFLVKETLAGKPKAFAKLMSLYKNRVTALGMSFFHNRTDTEDFVQDVFLKAYTNLSSFRNESMFSTWLTRIAYTTAINAKNRRKTFESIADETLLVDIDKTPEEQEIRRRTVLAVKEAIRELPEKYYICIELYFFYDMSYEEIEKITSIPVNTIKSHVFRAKSILRKKLEEL